MVDDSAAAPPGPGGQGRWVAAALSILAFVLGAPFVTEPFRDWLWWKLQGSPQLTCDNPGWLQEIRATNAIASSNLPVDDGITYFPANSVDGSLQTAWITLRPTDADSTWISWDLSGREDVLLICLTPGYAKSPDRFANQMRLKEIALSADDLQSVVSIPDRPMERYQDFHSVRTLCRSCSRLVLSVLTTHRVPGGHREVAISEVRFYADTRIAPLKTLFAER